VIPIAFAADTLSITVMEIFDNAIMVSYMPISMATRGEMPQPGGYCE
jgi:hypothetical protein